MIRKYFTLALISEKTGKVRKYKIPVKLLSFGITLVIVGILTFSFILREYLELQNRFYDSETAKEKIKRQSTLIAKFDGAIEENKLKLELMAEHAYKLRLLLSQEITSAKSGKSSFKKYAKNETETIDNNRVLRFIEGERQNQIKLSQNSAGGALIVSFLKNRTGYFDYVPSILPTKGFLISGFGFNETDPFTSSAGIKITTNIGAPVRATASGVVIFAENKKADNTVIKIYHDDNLITHYKNVSQVTVSYGDQVTKNQVIGQVGIDPQYKTPLLAYEVILNGIPQNPIAYTQQQ